MGNLRGLGLHLISVTILLVATTVTCFGVGNITVVCSQQERLALLTFKHSVQAHFGMLSSWVGNDCCRWERVGCDGVTGNVQRLHLRGDYYDGGDSGYLVGNELNSSLADLRHLKHLDLSGNYFQSPIPEFIGSFKKLRYLNLSYAGFHGIIPQHIGNISNLKVLDLHANGWGLIADDISWTFCLSSLEHLNLSSVDLRRAHNWEMVFYMIPTSQELSVSGCGLSNADVVPFLNSSRILPNIKCLDLGFNSFRGPLPRVFQNMTSLTFLDLSNFNLSLAWNFANLLNLIPSLSELHLSSCGFHKTFLSSPRLNFSMLSNIQNLDFRGNSIEGIFPSILTNMSSLRVLDLSANMLNSSIPVMPNLLHLDLSFNEFMHIEQVGMWSLCHLKQLKASDNYFDIQVTNSPKNISECSQYALERLDLSRSFIGTIPEPIGRLANLRGVDLSSNRLAGPIPESLTRLKYLEELNLSYNKLTGPIPTFLENLSILDLSYNQLNGSIPESFTELVALTNLKLEANRLTGSIPTSLGTLVSLQEISLRSNLLSGALPVSIGQLTKLHSLDISNNSLQGVVFEAHFIKLSMLKHLDFSLNTELTFNVSHDWIPPFQLVTLQLRSCNIRNGFPQWLRNQRKLDMLVLSNSTMSGPLPAWLQKMPIIPLLDLSHNKLCGTLTNLPNGDVFGYGFDGVLLLEYNLFNESIPRSLCKRADLRYLDLSRNWLTGKIPKCLGNLQRLVVMILGSNRLCGVIPSSLAHNYSSLSCLNLNDNNLQGELPQELGNLQYLEVLDLGDNKFSGNIPQWIGEKLTSLMFLRLHKNSFTGLIPLSLCRTSYLQILDVAYNSLTGTIPHCLGELNAMANNSQSRMHGDNFDSDENVIQVMKGVELEFTKTLDLVFNIDFSSNNLVGEIPFEMTTLSMLVGLNLSNNHLSGPIPDNIGNMTKLESLDLSRNDLIGMIPSSIASLTFLSHLNLSHNKFSGRIPNGNQLQTRTDPSIYDGNQDLCGPPLPKNCTNQEDLITTHNKKYEAADETAKEWLFYVDIMSGFSTGFWGIIGVLLFKKHWRQKLFISAEETMDRIYVAVVLKVAKMKRGR